MSTDYVKSNFRPPQSVALELSRDSSRQAAHRTISYRAVAPLAMTCDAVLIFSMSVLSGVIYSVEANGSIGDVPIFIGFAAVVAALFIALGSSHDIYKLPELLNFKSQFRNVAITWSLVFLFLTAVAFVMKVGPSFSRGAVLSFAVSGFMALIVARAAWRIYLFDGLAVSKFSKRQIALIAEQAPADNPELLESFIRNGLRPALQFILPAGHHNSEHRKEAIAKAILSLRGSSIEEIIVSADINHWPELSDVLSELRVLPLPVNIISVGPMSELFKLPSHTMGDSVTIELQRGPRSLTEQAVKRMADLLIAIAALILFMPLFLMTALAIKIDSPGSIIFRQWRRGFNGRPFQILKFRTMSVLEDGDTIVQAEPNDVRVTRIGSLLRRASIDELPQLLNVLQGTMSIVGPRPHAIAHDNKFDKIVGNYAYRHHVKPGLTGWAQVHGHRGQTITIEDIEVRTQLDLWYINNWNIALDIKILFMTVTELFFGKNAY